MSAYMRRIWFMLSVLLALVLLVSVLVVGRLQAGPREVGPLPGSAQGPPSRIASSVFTLPLTATVPTTFYLPVVFQGAQPPPLPPPLPPPTPVTGVPPIDFAAIQEVLQAEGQALAFAKIGFHVGPDIGDTDPELVGWMEALDEAGIPFFLKSADNAEPLLQAQELMASSGISHTLVYRKTGGRYDTPNYSLPPAEAAAIHWERHKAAFPKELDPSYVWIETVNEVDKNRSEWLGAFALETARLALADGYRWAAFGWSAGEPEPQHWASPSMLAFLRLAAAHPERLAVALHEYSYTVSGAGVGYPYHVGRFQHLFEICDSYRIDRPTVLITEWGWTYQEVPAVEQALADIAWANWLYAAYPQVRGAAIWYFGLGEEYGEISQQVKGLMTPLRDYGRSHYFVAATGWGAVDTWLFRPE